MTKNEKLEALRQYCAAQNLDQCGKCPIWETDIDCNDFEKIFWNNLTEADADRAYNIVFDKSENITESDNVNHPSYYNDGKIEVIEYIIDKKLSFCLGNAIKYISRAGKKYPDKEIEDLEKAIWYINHRIKELKEVNENA